MRQCYRTFKAKHEVMHKRPIGYHDFDYMCFHTPFSKMVQKAFFALVLEDMRLSADQEANKHDQQVQKDAAANGFKFDGKMQKILSKTLYQKEWQHKTERSLLLAK